MIYIEISRVNSFNMLNRKRCTFWVYWASHTAVHVVIVMWFEPGSLINVLCLFAQLMVICKPATRTASPSINCTWLYPVLHVLCTQTKELYISNFSTFHTCNIVHKIYTATYIVDGSICKHIILTPFFLSKNNLSGKISAFIFNLCYNNLLTFHYYLVI